MQRNKQTIKDLRKKEKISQKELADLLKISLSTIEKYETGKRHPSLLRAKQIACLFNTTVDDINFYPVATH